MPQHPVDPQATDRNIRHHHRTLFLSDLHLGAVGCRADRILAFLQQNSCDRLYLVGDILDLWHPLRPRWSAQHDAILALIRDRMRQGTDVVLLAGNHDAALLDRPSPLDGARVMRETAHRTARGDSLLVLHGDVCDGRILRHHLATRIGSRLDGALRGLDRGLRRLRRNLPEGHRSLIERLIATLNTWIACASTHEEKLVARARAGGHNGVVCGHFHIPALHDRHGLIYANCGDWVDSLTAIAEDAAGRLCLLTLPRQQPQPALPDGLPELEPAL